MAWSYFEKYYDYDLCWKDQAICDIIEYYPVSQSANEWMTSSFVEMSPFEEQSYIQLYLKKI